MNPRSTPSASSFDDLIASLTPKTIKPEVLLAGLDELLRHKPSIDQIGDHSEPVMAWRGRAAAVLTAWDRAASIRLGSIDMNIDSGQAFQVAQGYRSLVSLLYKARHTLQMQTIGPQSVPVEAGKPFDYFEGVRAIVERASTEVFFVDPYLDADFAARYLPFVPKGVQIRLLSGQHYLAKLLSAVDVFVAQACVKVEVRTTAFHDRFVFIDGSECHQSSGSFKDGGAKSPTLLVQITDGFDAMKQTYETKWNTATVHR